MTKTKKKKDDTMLHPSVSAIFRRYEKTAGRSTNSKSSSKSSGFGLVEKHFYQPEE